MTGVSAGVLAVMDAYSVPGQICCGMLVGGWHDGDGSGDPPSCCGQPFNESHMQEARANVAELIEAIEAFLVGRKWYNPLFANKQQYETFAAIEQRLQAAIARAGGAK